MSGEWPTGDPHPILETTLLNSSTGDERSVATMSDQGTEADAKKNLVLKAPLGERGEKGERRGLLPP
jgi:hypothetical protein